MRQREHLIRKICENPACDTARLIYADWLDEFGDENDVLDAEQIRVQIHFKDLSIPLPWRHPTIPTIHGLVRRGCVETVFASSTLFMLHAHELFSAYPITDVKFGNKLPFQVTMPGHPSIVVGYHWQFVRGVSLPPEAALRSALPMELMGAINGHPLSDGAGRFRMSEWAE